MGKRRVSSFHPGAFSGWDAYRYGLPQPSRADRIFNRKEREQLVDIALDEMRHWKRTPFEHEGEMTNALRSQLCLRGNRFAASEYEARQIVAGALTLMGAERPSEEETQRFHTDPRENCANCNRELDWEGGSKAYRFCGVPCAKAAVEKLDWDRKNERNRIYAAAQRVIKKGRTAGRSCGWCTETFYPVREASKQKTCSFSCGMKLRRALNPVPSLVFDCEFCGEPSETQARNGRFCSKLCGAAKIRMDRGIEPAVMSARLFDFVLYQERKARTGARMTDALFEAA